MRTHTEEAQCQTCGKTIHLADVPVPYWYHPDGQTIWCHMNDDTPPPKWADAATPPDRRTRV